MSVTQIVLLIMAWFLSFIAGVIIGYYSKKKEYAKDAFGTVLLCVSSVLFSTAIRL